MRGGEVLRKVELPVRPAARSLRGPQRHAAGHRHGDHRRVGQPRRPRPLPHRRARRQRLRRRWPAARSSSPRSPWWWTAPLDRPAVCRVPGTRPGSSGTPGTTGRVVTTDGPRRCLGSRRLPPTVPTTREKHSYEAHDPLTGAAAVAVLALAACGATTTPPPRREVVAAARPRLLVAASPWVRPTSPSPCLGEIYAGAIKAKGMTVTTKPNIGSRDIYIKALQDGSIDIVPEYTGSLLTFLKGTAPSQDPDAVYTALKSTFRPLSSSSTSRPPRTRTPWSSPRTPPASSR